MGQYVMQVEKKHLFLYLLDFQDSRCLHKLRLGVNSSPRIKPRLTGREIMQPTLIILSQDDQGSRSPQGEKSKSKTPDKRTTGSSERKVAKLRESSDWFRLAGA